MLSLDDLKMFRALGNAGSLAGAARDIGVTPPALTVRLQRLESRLGVHLAVRGARGVSLTDEGRRLLTESHNFLDSIEGLPGRIVGDAQALSGLVRVAAPFGFGRQHVARIVRDLHLANPDLTVMLTLSENPMAQASSHDVVVHIGAVKDSSWIGHVLAPNERFLCASPAFVKSMTEKLSDPSQIPRQRCLCVRENDDDTTTRWRFTHGGDGGEVKSSGKVVTVRAKGALASNDGEVVTRWAVDGLGMMVRSEWEAAPLIASGKLVRLLPQWQLDSAPVMALVPSRKGVSARLRGFIGAARAALQPVPWRRMAA